MKTTLILVGLTLPAFFGFQACSQPEPAPPPPMLMQAPVEPTEPPIPLVVDGEEYELVDDPSERRLFSRAGPTKIMKKKPVVKHVN